MPVLSQSFLLCHNNIMKYQVQLSLLHEKIQEYLFGKVTQIHLMLGAFLQEGHILIEDQPGTGKTTLAQVFSHFLGTQFQRIQFTSDLLPSDLLGINVYNKDTRQFELKKGPLWGQIILADEINRTGPKTQSALLEVMEERKITIDGQTYNMDECFMVLATQNPHSYLGTFPLPESQLDRFLVSFEMGDLSKEQEILLLKHGPTRDRFKELSAIFNHDEIKIMKKEVKEVQFSEALIHFLYEVIHTTRQFWPQREKFLGLTPRGGLALKKMSQAMAYIRGRNFVAHEDILDVTPFVCNHRLFWGEQRTWKEKKTLIDEMIQTLPTV